MEIREAEDRDIDGIMELFKICFGRELSLKEYEWKYKHSPWGSTAAIAIDDGNVIAHYGGIRTKFYFKGRTYEAFQPCDVMTHPKYRARIFSKRGAMVRAAELFYEINPMDFAFGFPSERHAVLGTKQLGYTRHRFVTLLRKKVQKSRILTPLFKIETGWEYVKRLELDVLWDKVKDNQGLSIVKHSDYILWRYRNNPSKHYIPVIVRDRIKRGDIKAFAICSIGEKEISIMDLFFVNTSALTFLLKSLENISLKKGLDAVTLWMNPYEESFRCLLSYGFTTEEGVPNLFKILNNEITPEFLNEKYSYRMGDYDAA
ncbi:MAG: GNAT family N-acetyltransferase [Thermodesulfovibrionales bacterium]